MDIFKISYMLLKTNISKQPDFPNPSRMSRKERSAGLPHPKLRG
jgi:hypothetical protein